MEGAGLGKLGLAHAALGETRRAVEYTQAALEIFEDIESPYAEQVRAALAQLKIGV